MWKIMGMILLRFFSDSSVNWSHSSCVRHVTLRIAGVNAATDQLVMVMKKSWGSFGGDIGTFSAFCMSIKRFQ
jgi:hypothetical protein